MQRFSIFLFLLFATAALPAAASAQIPAADGGPLFSKHNDEDRPKSFKEGLEKMRIDKEKKEHEEMISRGDSAAKLAEEVQEDIAALASTRDAESTPSLGLDAQIVLRDPDERSAFLRDVQRAFTRLAEKYGGTKGDAYRIALACYPKEK